MTPNEERAWCAAADLIRPLSAHVARKILDAHNGSDDDRRAMMTYLGTPNRERWSPEFYNAVKAARKLIIIAKWSADRRSDQTTLKENAMTITTYDLAIGLDPSERFAYLGLDRLAVLNAILARVPQLSGGKSTFQLVNGKNPCIVITDTPFPVGQIAALASTLGQDCIALRATTQSMGETTVSVQLIGPHAAAYVTNPDSFGSAA